MTEKDDAVTVVNLLVTTVADLTFLTMTLMYEMVLSTKRWQKY